MRYEDEDGGVRGAASRYDRWGTRRGSPYAADPGYDDPPAGGAWTGGAGGGYAGSVNRWDGGAEGAAGAADGGWGDGGWADADEPAAADIGVYPGPWLPPYVWARWRRRPWFPRLHGMLRRARPIGTLRRRGTGERLPVFRGRMGGRSWRVVTRPRGMRFEVVGLEAETGDEPLAMDDGGADALGGAGGYADAGDGAANGFADSAGFGNSIDGAAGFGGSTGGSAGDGGGWASADPSIGGGGGWASADPSMSGGGGWASVNPSMDVGGGYRLRLPHAGLHTILGRLRPEQLRRLAGGPLPADPAAAVARGVGCVARRARRLGRFRGAAGGPRLDVFGTPGFRMLVRPTGGMEGEILAVTPVAGEEEVYADGEKDYRRSVGGKKYRVRGAIATVSWSAPVTLAKVRALTPPASAVYVLLKNNRPVYVGETASWVSRWETRLQTLSEFGIGAGPFKVAVGTITWAGPGPKPRDDLLRNDVEHILVRGLRNAGLKMNNRTSNVEILAPRGGRFRVENINPPPGFPTRPMEPASSDTPYELEWMQ